MFTSLQVRRNSSFHVARSILFTIGVGLQIATHVPVIHAASPFAESVLDYRPGTGVATEFGTGSTYTRTESILGAPAAVTPGQFGGPVDPFSPPYQLEQLLSIGAGGSVTVQMGQAILNSSLNPFGIDFTVFGSAGFVISNGDFSGGGVTDGTLFSATEGSTRVSVSQDGRLFYQLDPAKAPTLDSLFPTDGSGSPGIPMNPALSSSEFAGRGLAGIRSLYAGSAGGAGFDLSWARDERGNPVQLDSVRFVRLDVLTGHAEIDAISVVPEPSVAGLVALGTLVGAFFKAGLVRRLRQGFKS